MKVKYFFQLFFVVASLTIFNCSSDSDGNGNGDGDGDGDNNQITSLTVSISNTANVFVGDIININVVGNTGENVTSTSTITVNDVAITGSSYQTTSAGTLTIKATHNNITSNTIQVQVQEVTVISGITLSTTSSGDVFVGDTVSFSVIADTGQDVTSTSTISVNGAVISGNSYVTTAVGTLTVTADYDTFTSNTLTIEVLTPPVKFKKNALIEDYTGTWCGYCPRVSHAIELVKQQTDQAYVVAVHNDSEFYCSEVAQLENAFGISGYPTAKLNRKTDWTFPEPNNVAQVVDLTGNDADLGIAVNPTLNGNTMSIEVSAQFNELFTFNNTKLVVFILEDDLIADQENYTSYYGGVSTIPNFEHDHVLRESLTNVSGDAISQGDVVNMLYSRTFTANVPSNISDTSKMSVIAFISNDDFIGAPEVVNTRVAHFGDTQTFQEE